jgi:hypothetical protein
LVISPGQNNKPLNIICDKQAEELLFPSIYLGQAGTFMTNVKVTPFMTATSEIRRTDEVLSDFLKERQDIILASICSLNDMWTIYSARTKFRTLAVTDLS